MKRILEWTLIVAGFLLLARLTTAHADYLPHRPLSEIDIQGHQDTSCGDRIPMYSDGFFIECMPIYRQQASECVDQPPKFCTMERAALVALAATYQISQYYEYGGIVGRDEQGMYGASLPDTDYEGDRVEIDQDPDNYNHGITIVATYHTHPCLPRSHIPQLFSVPDLRIAREFNRPAFVANLCNGEVREYVPGADEVVEYKGQRMSKGHLVGTFKVSGTPLELPR